MDLRIEPELAQAHPGLSVEYIVLKNTTVAKSPPRLKKLLGRLEHQVRSGTEGDPLLPSQPINLRAWASFIQNVKGDASAPAPAELVSVIRHGGSAPRISNVVDLANTSSISTGLPVGAFDLDQIDGDPLLRRSTEGEQYVALFETNTTVIPAGEIVYSDSLGVFSRYTKDAHRTRITEVTTTVLFVIDACPGVAEASLTDASAMLLQLIGDVLPDSLVEPPRRSVLLD